MALNGSHHGQQVLIPFDRGDMIAAVHREGQVLVEQAEADGMRVRARLEQGSIGRLREFVVADAPLDSRS